MLRDGVYFGLDDFLYHSDPAIGSTDHKLLAQAPEAYWFGSIHNPARPADKDTPARALGRGVHKCALEGRDAFERTFIRRPEDLERLTEKVRAVLAPRGETILGCDEYDRALLASTMIRCHPDLSTALSGGAPEVSVFWTTEIDGEEVRCKARFDYLKPRSVVDLKSIAVLEPQPFEKLCLRAIRKFRYMVQADLYLEARAELPRFADEGAVFGEFDSEWFDRVAYAPDYAFTWVFWASSGPPLVWAGYVSPGSPLLDDPRSIVTQARRNYVRFRQNFGMATPWIEYQRLAEIVPEDIDAAFSRD